MGILDWLFGKKRENLATQRASVAAPKTTTLITPSAAIHVFDYTRIEATSYGEWACRKIKKALSNSKGMVALNDGDLSSWTVIRSLAENANRVVPATATQKTSPLSSISDDHHVGVYVASVWAEQNTVHEEVRAVFDCAGTDCYLGYLLFDNAGPQPSWNATMRQKLYLVPDIIIVDGRVSGGNNKYYI